MQEPINRSLPGQFQLWLDDWAIAEACDVELYRRGVAKLFDLFHPHHIGTPGHEWPHCCA